jgi:prephenate dehydratase
LRIRGQRTPVTSITEIFDAVMRGGLGVVPVENTLEGPVNETLDNLYNRDEIFVNFRIDLPIRLVLAAREGTRLEDIDTVFSHNHAIHEARSWLLKAGLTNLVPVESTSKAARMALNEPRSAAVCSELASRIYGLKVLARDIQDGVNITKFIVISKSYTDQGDKSIIFFTVPDRPGGLYMALEKFYKKNINLTMIYSRPTKVIPWNYYFYLEFEGDIRSAERSGLIQDLRGSTLELKIKGSYRTL